MPFASLLTFTSMALVLALTARGASAADGDTVVNATSTLPNWSTKAVYQPSPVRAAAAPAGYTGALVVSAPPSADRARQRDLYLPVAEYLSKVLGRSVVFKGADNWLAYSKAMTAGEFDLVLDDSHFTAWRVERIQHTPLVRISEDVSFVIVTDASDDKVRKLRDLEGRRVCGMAGPRLGMLVTFAQFTNPARQPYLVESPDWDSVVQAFAAGKCAGAILPAATAEKHKNGMRVLYQSSSYPGLALSAGPRIGDELKTKIVHALTEDPAGKTATRKLRENYGIRDFVASQGQEYAGLSDLLKDSLYYR